MSRLAFRVCTREALPTVEKMGDTAVRIHWEECGGLPAVPLRAPVLLLGGGSPCCCSAVLPVLPSHLPRLSLEEEKPA